jgi:hypothetical protein
VGGNLPIRSASLISKGRTIFPEVFFEEKSAAKVVHSYVNKFALSGKTDNTEK